MTILKGDIKLVASTVMDDVDEGGGPPSSHVIDDTNSNEIFNDISELDRAGGRVSLRKVFAHVRTTNTDRYLGANAIVAVPFEDPNVSATLFTTGDTFDTRDQASSRVEAYLNAGPEWAGYLFENHIEGQRSVQLFMRTTQALPPIGRTLLLREDEGTGTEFEQYVRITRVSVEERTFTYNSDQDYQANVVTLDISDALRFDFTGSPASRSFTKANGAAIVRDTVVADAATYYGVVALEDAVAIGDAKVKCESVYTQLVPNSRTETPLVDVSPSSSYLITLASSPREVTFGGAPLSQRIRIGQENRGFSYVTILSPLPGPGTLRIAYRALGNTYEILDNGDGTIGGSSSPGTGTVNYTTGSVSITFNSLPDDRSAVVFYWGEKQNYTNRAGSTSFRPPEYSFTLEHDGVDPGSVTITWESGAVVKTATDNGSGQLTGDATGDVNYNTGAVFIRPSAMLDPSSVFNIEYDWVAVEEEEHFGLTPDGSGSVGFTLAEQPVPGTVQIMWVTTRETSESSGASSTMGNSTKSSSSSNTTAMVEQSRYVPPSSVWAGGPIISGGGGGGGGGWSGGGPSGYGTPFSGYKTIPGYTVTTRTPQSVSRQQSSSDSSSYTQLTSQTSRTHVSVAHTVTDDGAGNLFGTLGTVGYVSKAVSVKVTGDYSETSYQSNYENASAFESLNATSESTATVGGPTPPSVEAGGGGSSTAKGGNTGAHSQKDIYGASTLTVRYVTGTPTPAAADEEFVPPNVVIDLTPTSRDYVVPGSLKFTWMGHTYSDFEGVIYRDRVDGVDPGIESGGINYYSAIVTMTDYVVGPSPASITINSMWTTVRAVETSNMVFNTSLAPVKPSALVLSVIGADGEQIIATSDNDGGITGSHCHGKIDYESGLVEVQFGDYVLDSGLTAEQKAEWWYDADDVRTSDGKIWKPWPVAPNTMRYNFVSYFYLPLDADILGLDPVRLPQDGRVPIFRPGAFAVLGHTGTVGPATVSNGQTINCGRTRLSRVRVIGDDGDIIDSGYTEDLDAGTVTFTDITGYSQPVTVEHRIEDMAMVSDVQINGFVSFTRQITHAYPVPGSYLSSALVAGDVRSRVQLTFDQATWNNIWADVVNGSGPATGTFNTALHPIVVNNLGALTERWAVVFTNSTSFNVIGEHTGVIATGNTSGDCAPLNQATGTPYFTIPYLGWGLGWATGNVLRFNTIGAQVPLWIARTVLQGPETVVDDRFQLIVRGDVDRP